MDNSYRKIAGDITSFFYDYDTYEFVDNYDTYEEGLNETINMLSSINNIKELIYNIDNICDDLKDDDDSSIRDLYNRGINIINELNNIINDNEMEV